MKQSSLLFLEFIIRNTLLPKIINFIIKDNITNTLCKTIAHLTEGLETKQ